MAHRASAPLANARPTVYLKAMSLTLPFESTYAALPERFHTRMPPEPVAEPSLIALNRPLAQEMGLDPDILASVDGIAVLAGNAVADGSEPLAQVYAGHQFGGWSPRLGDGRALLLGEVVRPDGARVDVQLKGSGPTPYSRMGDGRAWLGPVLREYIVSEAMAALGVPTTRALAAVATGETVVRETPLPGAILTRVAASHLRVGTFQYFFSQNDEDALNALADYAIERHYPDADGPLGLLDGVIARQADLVARWLGLGFIHGVMNTDNMTISGETIDYGPCAFMDVYHPMRVFSSIDAHGRYAYARQPDIAMWNLAQLASALMPLIGSLEDAQASLDRFPTLFQTAWLRTFGAKIGLSNAGEDDVALIHRLLDIMAANQADFTNTFRALSGENARDQFLDPTVFDAWEAEWKARLGGTVTDTHRAAMDAANPAVIPRTHRIEQAIEAAVKDDFAPFHRLNKALAAPFDDRDDDLTRPPTESEIVPQTFCGT